MSKDDDNSIFDELDSRLDDFFAEDDIVEEDSGEFLSDDFFLEEGAEENEMFESEQQDMNMPEINAEKTDNSPLDSLKAIVLEMDWEINDENLSNYLSEIDNLRINYSHDRAIFLLFKLHNAIGKYMLHKKAGAHPDALKFLYQIFNSLEKIVTKDLSDFEKNKVVLTEIANFKNLKAKMFPDKYKPGTIPSGYASVPGKRKRPDFTNLPSEIQKEINDYIEREISMKIEALKKELKS